MNHSIASRSDGGVNFDTVQTDSKEVKRNKITNSEGMILDSRGLRAKPETSGCRFTPHPTRTCKGSLLIIPLWGNEIIYWDNYRIIYNSLYFGWLRSPYLGNYYLCSECFSLGIEGE